MGRSAVRSPGGYRGYGMPDPQPRKQNVDPAPQGVGESAFLSWVKQRQARSLELSPHQGILLGAGDDLAVLKWPGKLLLLGADPVLDGVHVEVSQHGTAAAGRKAMNRNLSDVAAMGGEPVAAILSLVVPKTMDLTQVQEVYLGAEQAGATAACPIVGGDFSSWEGRLVATLGILARAQRPVLRGRAKAGQTVFVTGAMGGSILGRHLTFAPRLELGQTIASEYGASAMIDISDGLAIDLARLLGDAVGATIEEGALPVHDDALRLSRRTGRTPLWHALNDGEDYELLFTADAGSLPGCFAIGHVEAEPGLRMARGGTVEKLAAEGWEHRFNV